MEKVKEEKKFNNTPNDKHIIDGKEVWFSRSVAVSGIIFLIKGNEIYILIGKRGKAAADFQGYWNLPCGYLDRDETLTECFKREVYEETGFDIDKMLKKQPAIDKYNNLDFPFRIHDDPKTSNRQNVTMFYSVGFWIENQETPLPKLTTENNDVIDEVDGLMWMHQDDIDEYDFAFNHKDRINDFIRDF